MSYCTPKEIVDNALQVGMNKVLLSKTHMLALGMLAGAYIAFGAEGSTMAMHDISSVGFGRFLAGVIFATGLMLVVICGGELFTGNVLLWVGYLEKKVSLAAMLRNWVWVYAGNLAGAILLAYLMDRSGLWHYNNYLHGAYVLKLAIGNLTAGLVAKAASRIVAASGMGAKVDMFTISSAVINNLIPVTLGNIVGGAIFVGSYYWYCYLKNQNSRS